MKKLLIFLPVILIATFMFPNNSSFTKNKATLSKEIELSIVSNNNYSSAAYDNAMANIEITVKKISGDHNTTVYKKTFSAMQLSKYPLAANAGKTNVHISNIAKKGETIVISYTITYNTKGSIVQFQNEEVLNNDTKNDKLDIKI